MHLQSHVDHLVIAADSLEQGVEWCEATLGVTPHAGGEHPLMGTHNRLLRIASPGYPASYLEIIAINPAAHDPGRVRWFGLDEEPLRAALRESPRLIHFVARTDNADAAVEAWKALGLDPGPLLQVERATAHGMLRWRMAIRPDGARQFNGALPTLIEWATHHPAASLPHSTLHLEALQLRHPDGDRLKQALDAIGLAGVRVETGPAGIVASLRTPQELVHISSGGV